MVLNFTINNYYNKIFKVLKIMGKFDQAISTLINEGKGM